MAERTRDTQSMFGELSPPYATVVADPPWPYDSPGDHLRSTPEHRPLSWDNQHSGPGAARRYSLMSMDDLEAMPVQSIADDNAHLYLWTTNAFIEHAHRIARAWGFEPKTVLTWVKMRHDDSGQPSMKTGYYFRGATEHVLFCVRGSLPLQTDEALPTAYLWRRVAEHSAKPDAFMDLVEQASPGPYVELFSRRPRLGWHSWGHGYEVAS